PEIGVEYPIPFYLITTISSLAAHNCSERAVGHLASFVQWLVFKYRLNQSAVLVDITLILTLFDLRPPALAIFCSDEISAIVQFANMVTAQPNVMIPISNLLLELGCPLVTAMPDWSGIDPVRSERNKISDRAVLNPLHRLNVAWAMAALRSRRHFEILLFRFL